jgi:hypothetical protein
LHPVSWRIRIQTMDEGWVAMLGSLVLRSALSAMSTLFGSLGVFMLYLSFSWPALAAHAILFLCTASGIVLSAPK